MRNRWADVSGARMFDSTLCEQSHRNLIAGTCPWCGQEILEGKSFLWTFDGGFPCTRQDAEQFVDFAIESLANYLGRKDLDSARCTFEQLLAAPLSSSRTDIGTRVACTLSRDGVLRISVDEDSIAIFLRSSAWSPYR